ncbi:30S ribosomal protein S17 [Candidatus Falkowbacteria bacterium]|jgi:small subunit ribosomal protein S17|nr:30S ribosomal protein S17 [Candidatus Falkowbacteria bacterium]
MKSIKGIVESLKNDKTAKVKVVRLWQHPLYQKSVKRTKAYACHYENINLEVGDEVVIAAIRPMSKTKRFTVVSKVGGAK